MSCLADGWLWLACTVDRCIMITSCNIGSCHLMLPVASNYTLLSQMAKSIIWMTAARGVGTSHLQTIAGQGVVEKRCDLKASLSLFFLLNIRDPLSSLIRNGMSHGKWWHLGCCGGCPITL